uniref:Inducible plastid-lipid associated protein n=1 Tax=Solanum tuberosum TaxID=4113 RepID=M1C0M1_SOLTU
MAFSVASGSFCMPAMAANAGHSRTPMSIGIGRVSVANSRVPFVCLASTVTSHSFVLSFIT